MNDITIMISSSMYKKILVEYLKRFLEEKKAEFAGISRWETDTWKLSIVYV